MEHYVIHCDTIENFIAACAGLVIRGVCFEASTDTLTITPTGGY